MIEIIAPLVSANEDNARVVEINKKNNQICNTNDIICVLETSKASLEVEASGSGYIYNFYRVGDEVNAGDILAIISENKIVKKDIDYFLDKKKVHKNDNKVSITKKAQLIISSNKINYKEIKSRGIIKEEDVLSYLKKNSKKAIKNDDYIKLEEIMKLSASEIKDINFNDIKKLKETLLSIQNIYKKKWNRTVPSLEAIFDRWVSGKQYSSDDKTNISHLAYIIGNVKIGKNTYVGPFTFLDGGGSLVIGDNTSIAAGVQIYSHDNISRALSGHKLNTVYSKTEIGNNCFIGPNSVITRGLTIGDHCFIGGNSTVTFDVPPYTAVSGSPAEKIGKVKIENDGSVKISKERSY
jgi:acetyltransferase-like isoleucine patch superfamily enzyme